MWKKIQVSIKEEGLSLAFSLIVDIPYHTFLSCVLLPSPIPSSKVPFTVVLFLFQSFTVVSFSYGTLHCSAFLLLNKVFESDPG